MASNNPVTTIGAHPTATDALRARVRSFAADSLHSVAYLSNYLSYLSRASRNSNTPIQLHTRPGLGGHQKNFLYSYNLANLLPQKPLAFGDVEAFLAAISGGSLHGDDPELIFLTGSPSPQWLAAVAEHYQLDHRLLHRHLDFLPNAQRDWFTSPLLPSRAVGSVRLLIPSIIFLGPEDRYVSAKKLQRSRITASEQLRQMSKSFLGAVPKAAGQSIIRQINIHRGDTIVIEQALTVIIVKEDRTLKFLVWSDAGEDVTPDQLPLPSLDGFENVLSELEFCPVFYEVDLLEKQRPNLTASLRQNGSQPLSILSSRYGETLNGVAFTHDEASLALGELFQFHVAASMQYLNMMRKHTTRLINENPLRDNGTLDMEALLQFDHTKTVLLRWKAHFRELLDTLDMESPNNPILIQAPKDKCEAMLGRLLRDFRYLQTEAVTLIELCDSGRSAIMSSFSLSESNRTARETQLVTQLTQLTTRLTFIFLPMAYITSVFGMNFKELGQGSLSIWIWAAVTMPLLIISLVVVERKTFVDFVRYIQHRKSD